jgi:soluble lytic murein transglycosylase-like protein
MPTLGASAETATPGPTAPPVDAKIEIRKGAVYKVAKSNGITEYTNIKPARGGYQVLFTYMATCFACNVHSTINWGATPLRLDAYRDEIAAASSEFGVDQALLRAIIHAESAFNPNAVSVKGAQGLMQLMPGTASDLGVANPFDATQNIRGGAQYLAGLLHQFNGNERLAAAAYDAGPQNVQKYNGVPPFDETQVYVERVGTLRARYHDANGVPPVAAALPRPSVPSS